MRLTDFRPAWLVAPALLLLTSAAGIATNGKASAAAPSGPDGFAISRPRLRIPQVLRGENAVRSLGANRLNNIGARYGLSGQHVANALRQDRDLAVDTHTRLVYTCNFRDVSGGKSKKKKSGAAAATVSGAPQRAPFPLADTFTIHSRPEATRKIYLDFDGHVTSGTPWNTSGDITNLAFSLDGDRATFNDAEREAIQAIWQRVVEDFAPWDVDVTTEEPAPEFLSRSGSNDTSYGIRVVITPTDTAAPGAGGVAFLGSFIGDSDVGCFAFSESVGNTPENIAEVISHEVGHTVGLEHDGLTDGTEYYSGHGTWGPIMGASYGRAIVQFSRGEYLNANNLQDDLAVIPTFGMPLFPDEAGSTLATAKELEGLQPVVQGVISGPDDIDVYKFFSGAGNISLDVAVAESSPNLDLQLTLYDANGNLLTVTNPVGLPAAINRVVTGGTMYLAIDGVGTGNASSGYSDYGSIGQYTLSATLVRSFRILAPTTGDSLIVGQPTEIRWSSEGLPLPSNVKIDYSSDGGTTWEAVVASTPNALEGSFEWTPTGEPTTQGRIRLSLVETPSINVSTGNFQVLRGALDVTSPSGGERLTRGRRVTLRWETSDFASLLPRVKVELSRDGGSNWDVVFANTPNDGQQDWIVTGPETDEALLRISTINPSIFSDESDEFFSIREPSSLTVTAPNGPETLVAGQPTNITWDSTGFSGNVKIELTRNAGSDWETLFPNIENDGEEEWTVSGPASRSVRLRITSIEEPAVSDSSNGFLVIAVPTITITKPAKGDKGLIGSTLAVEWNSTGVAGNSTVRIDLSRDGGGSWMPVIAGTPNDGSAEFDLSGPAATNALVRVVAQDGSNAIGISTAFAINPPTLFVVNPNGGEKLKIGKQTVIQWSGTSVGSGAVDIFLSRDGGRTFSAQPIIANTPNDGGELWGVRGPQTKKAVIRIVWKPLPSVQARSAGRFQIIKKGKLR